MPMWSLDSTSMSGCLHSVGIATHLVRVPFILFFFSKPHLRLETSRNRKYNQHILLQFVFVHVDWSCHQCWWSWSFSRANPWLWGTPPQHEISGVLVDLQLLSLGWRVWSEMSFCPASAAAGVKIVQNPRVFCIIFMDLNKVPAACLSLNKPKGYFGLRTNSLLQGLIFFKVLLQPNQSSPLCAHLQVSCWPTVSIMQY